MKEIKMDFETYRDELICEFNAGYNVALHSFKTWLCVSGEINDGQIVFKEKALKNDSLKEVIKQINNMKKQLLDLKKREKECL